MKTHAWFVAASLSALLSASSVSAQDPSASETLPLTLSMGGGTTAADGVTEFPAGETVKAVLAVTDGASYLGGALFICGAAAPGEFKLIEEGLVLLDAFDAAGRLHAYFQTHPGLAGLMIAGRGYAYDGERIVESPVQTIRFL
jgi:hypothetical protein